MKIKKIKEYVTMMRNVSKVIRGSIWYIALSPEEAQLSLSQRNSIQKKSRPWLVTSNDRNNFNSTVFNAVPITTKEDDGLPCHVFYVGDEDRPQVIECEQISSKSIQDINRKGSFYIGQLSPEIMAKVDKALAIQQGIDYMSEPSQMSLPDLSNLASVIDNIITTKSNEAISKTTSAAQSMIDMITQKLAGLEFSSPVVDTEIMTNESVVNTDEDSESSDSCKSVTTDDSVSQSSDSTESKSRSAFVPVELSSNSSTTRRNNKWSTDAMKKFLQDCDALSPQEMADTYQCSIKSIYSMKYKFKRLVEDNIE